MKDIRLAVRHQLRGYLNPLILRSCGRTFAISEAIIVSGHFRSGTTWLAELIAKSINAGIIFEPFHIDHVSAAKLAGFTYHNFRQPADHWPDGRNFVESVLRGKHLNRWSVAHIPLNQTWRVKRLLIKLVAANQMLVWLIRNFDVPTPVLLIRHPCAVLASWLSRGWRLNDWIVRDPALLESFPELDEILNGLRHKEEYFAARWCLDYYVPISYQRNREFLTVSFEKLVVEGAPYLAEVLSTWGSNLPGRVVDEIRRPSERASGSLKVNYETVLSGWKSTLSSIQIDRVLRVVRDFGLDFYTADIEPDYERLFGDRPIRKQGTSSP